MADEVEAALPGSRTTTRPGTPGLDLRAGIAWQLTRFGCHGHRYRSALHGRRPDICSAIGAVPRPGDWRRWCGWNDRDGGRPLRARRPRIGIDRIRWRAVRSRLAAAAEAAGRNVSEIELLPITKFFPATDVAILSRLGCRSVGESREQEASAKVAELVRLLASSHRADSRAMHWHMVGQIQRNKARALAGWAHTAHSVDSPRLVAALDRGGGHGAGRPAPRKPRCASMSKSASTVTCPAAASTCTAPGAVDEVCARIAEADEPGIGRVDGHPAAGLGPE